MFGRCDAGSDRPPLLAARGGEAPGTLDELGAAIGVTRERVRRLEVKARRALRDSAPGPRL
jgi:DNA-directed RNA polymerase sigma subunit (sigma70/sigma32)